MSLNRRNIFASASAAVAALVTFKASASDTPVGTTSGSQAPLAVQVVYHLSDLDKVGFVLGNIANHFKGVGGPDKVHIELVVHGPALAAFKTGKADADLKRRTAELSEQGVGLGACGNTLDAQQMQVAELLPGFVRIDEGGVVRLANLQAQGYAYLRP